MNPFTEFAFSEQGYNHIKVSKECQDASGAYSDDDMSIIVVADGHGSDNYPRTARGSSFAVDAAIAAIKEFVKTVTDEKIDIDPQQEKQTESQMRELSANILKRWHDSVDQDITEHPLDERELEKVSEKYKQRYQSGNYNAKAYGTTLIAICATANYWFGLHIGDGKCVTFEANGSCNEPIPWDDTCQSNITTSICDEDALDEFRYYCSKKLPLAVFIGSDGVDDSYANNEELYAVYRAMIRIFEEHGADTVKQEIKEFLPKTSKNGSGDDVSIAGMIRSLTSQSEIDCFKAREIYSAVELKLKQKEADYKIASERVTYISDAMEKAQHSLLDAKEKYMKAQETLERVAAELAVTRKQFEEAENRLDDLNSKQEPVEPEKQAQEIDVSSDIAQGNVPCWAENEKMPEANFSGHWYCEKEASLDGYETELSVDLKDKTFYIVRTSSNGAEQAYAVPNEKPDIISCGDINYSLENGELVEYHLKSGQTVYFQKD